MTVQEQEIDLIRVEAFASELMATYNGAITTAMVNIGHRTGLFDIAAEVGPSTSAELAAAAGLHERYVREWLSAVAAAGIFTYDPTTATFTLPAEHAALLTGPTASNIAGHSLLCTFVTKFVEPVVEAFRNGGGVSYEEQAGFAEVMDAINRPIYDEALVTTYLPMVTGLAERLALGATVGDIGTGSGHPLNLLAQAFPSSTFVGFDISESGIAAASKEAASMGLGNVWFEQRDVAAIDEVERFDVLFAFDAIHDQAHPATVLRNIRRALKDDGLFVMIDIKASSHLEDNCANPLGPLLYGMSTLHCMTVSLAQGGDGLGTAWGEQVACQMLREAGFTTVEVNEIPQDPFNLVYVCRP